MILKGLGLHHKLKSQKLLIELYPWFEDVSDFNRGSESENGKFAPAKNGDGTPLIIGNNAENVNWQGL